MTCWHRCDFGLTPLRKCGDGLTCGLESVEQVLNLGDGFRSSGCGEQIDNALQDVAEAFGRNCVLGLQCPELGDYLGK